MKGGPVETHRRPPVAVIFGAVHDAEDAAVGLDELAGLAEAADVGVAARLVQRLHRPHPATYIGSGKVEELKELCASVGADVVLADMDLSPAQVRNLTREVGVRVVDRSELILDIFARRAHSSQAKLQVELAQLQYALPRLRGQWEHLDRYRGGGVGTRGPGEKQIETDRRLVHRRIRDLQSRLQLYEGRTRRNIDARAGARKVALAGYTNTGKSTLFNVLTGGDVYAANRLFATLDTRTRRWPIPRCPEVVLSDTVGFVRDLPHHLVSSFHATLEEVVEADLILHLIDATAPHAAACIAAVEQTLDTIGAGAVPRLPVLNKVDLVHDRLDLCALQNSQPGSLTLSARTGEGLDALAARVRDLFGGMVHEVEVLLPVDAGRQLARLAVLAELLEQRIEGERLAVRLAVDDARLGALRAQVEREGLELRVAPEPNGRRRA